jgi:hypothetical protein
LRTAIACYERSFTEQAGRPVTKLNRTVLLQEYNESDREGAITEKERKEVDDCFDK